MSLKPTYYHKGDIVKTYSILEECDQIGIIIETDYNPRVLINDAIDEDAEYALYGILWDDGAVSYSLGKELELITD